MAGFAGASFLSNIIGGQLSASTQMANQSQLMAKQDEYNRKFTRDQYGLMVSGMQDAGLNPAVGLQGSPVQQSAPQASAPSIAGVDASQSALNSAMVEKTKAETTNIESKTPGEVTKLKSEADYYQSQSELNKYLSENTQIDSLLKKSHIDMNDVEIVKGKLQIGSMAIDLKYSQDMQSLYNEVVKQLSDLTGVDKKKAGGIAQVFSKFVKSAVDFLGKKNIAGDIGKNRSPAQNYHLHQHNNRYVGDRYNVNTSSFNKSG